MIKKLTFVMLVLLLIVPATNSFSTTFNYAALWSEHKYYESTGSSEYGMVADTAPSDNFHDVYIYIPTWTGHEYHQLNYIFYVGAFDAGKFLKPSDGYPAPGGSYEEREIYFFVDEDGSGDFNSLYDTYEIRNYPSGTFSQLPLVTNVKISYLGSDVIVSWDGIAIAGEFGNDENDQYRVRIIDKTSSDILFDSNKISINSITNKYAYNLGDLSVYGEDIWVAIEAREGIGTNGLANRSRYYASVPPVSDICEGDLDGNGVVDGSDLAIFAADFGRTDCP